jgi:hypothetical protein
MDALEGRIRLEIEGAEHRIIAAVRRELVSQARFFAVNDGHRGGRLVGAMTTRG